MSRKFSLLTLGSFLLLASCSGQKVEANKVFEDVTAAMCKRLITCQPEAMPSEDFCRSTMKTALSAQKNMPKVEATQKQLDACVASINQGSCDSLMGSEPPKDCDFLK